MSRSEAAWLRLTPVLLAVVIVAAVATMCSACFGLNAYSDSDLARDALIAYARRDAR